MCRLRSELIVLTDNQQAAQPTGWLSFRKIFKGAKVEYSVLWGGMYKIGVLCTPTAQGGLGTCSPRDFSVLRLFEVIFSAFSDHSDVTV